MLNTSLVENGPALGQSAPLCATDLSHLVHAGRLEEATRILSGAQSPCVSRDTFTALIKAWAHTRQRDAAACTALKALAAAALSRTSDGAPSAVVLGGLDARLFYVMLKALTPRLLHTRADGVVVAADVNSWHPIMWWPLKKSLAAVVDAAVRAVHSGECAPPPNKLVMAVVAALVRLDRGADALAFALHSRDVHRVPLSSALWEQLQLGHAGNAEIAQKIMDQGVQLGFRPSVVAFEVRTRACMCVCVWLDGLKFCWRSCLCLWANGGRAAVSIF